MTGAQKGYRDAFAGPVSANLLNQVVSQAAAEPDGSTRAGQSGVRGRSGDWILGTGGISIAIALFLSVAVLLGITLDALRDGIGLVEQSERSLLQVSNLREALFDAGNSARTFVTEHDRSFLVSLQRAHKNVVQELDVLAVQVANEPEALRQVNELRPIIARRLAALDEMVRIAADPASAGRIAAGDGERVRLSRLVYSKLARLRAEEQKLLVDRQGRANDAAAFAIALSIFTAIAAPFCGAVGIYLLHRERSRHQAREIEIEMMHAQRLAIMGETASMLAHEIKQPLSAAKNYLSALRRHLVSGPSAPAEGVGGLVEKVNEQINRTNNIVQRLRNFIEKRDDERVIESTDLLVADAVALLGTIDDGIKLQTQIEPGLPDVVVDPIQLQQVLVNLMRNAIEAMQDSALRELYLSASALAPDTVLISVEDTGPGLLPSVAANLFKPFVSTKSGGMGVGLSICRSIVAAHGGRIWAEPAKSGGAVFRFTLQAAQGDEAA